MMGLQHISVTLFEVFYQLWRMDRKIGPVPLTAPSLDLDPLDFQAICLCSRHSAIAETLRRRVLDAFETVCQYVDGYDGRERDPTGWKQTDAILNICYEFLR